MILVTSALGNQGRRLVPLLASRGFAVRALDRASGGAARLDALGACESVAADLSDAAALREALRGVDCVYHIGPNAHPDEQGIGIRMIDLARSEGVRHFVFASVLHPQIEALTQHDAKLKVERHLIESGLAFTILQPAHYMQTLQHRAAFAGAPFRLTWSLERRQSLIDVDDLVEVAALILAEGPDEHDGATYELSSGDRLTAADIAERIGRVTGRTPAIEEVSPAAVIASVFGDDPDRERFEQRVRLFEVVARWYSRHDFIGNAKVATMLLGRAPTDFEGFLRRDYAAWMADPSAAR